MGRLFVTEFMTLDGVAQSPGGPDEDREGGFPYGGWQAPLEEPEAGGVLLEETGSMDALLLGRKTYEIFAEYWPHAPEEIPFTGLFRRIPKYVASRTLSEPLGWDGTQLVTGDLIQSVAELKDRHDHIHMFGSLDFLQSLLEHGLVDRLYLWQYPVVLGTGKRVFEEGAVPTVLRVVESRTHPRGLTHLVCEPAGPPTFREADAEYR
ncbi:MAG TPA: dihydrofolate reductase family protein [Acidimicrobiia bacterium]|nr:dihydrofolate reductase family protein [Acidimicrobiia bacterium]